MVDEVAEPRPELTEIIVALTMGTQERRIDWTWVNEENHAVAELESGRVIVGKDNDADTYVTIEDSNRNTMEYINVGYRANRYLQVDADSLYTVARRAALKIDATLMSILREIS